MLHHCFQQSINRQKSTRAVDVYNFSVARSTVRCGGLCSSFLSLWRGQRHFVTTVAAVDTEATPFALWFWTIILSLKGNDYLASTHFPHEPWVEEKYLKQDLPTCLPVCSGGSLHSLFQRGSCWQVLLHCQRARFVHTNIGWGALAQRMRFRASAFRRDSSCRPAARPERLWGAEVTKMEELQSRHGPLHFFSAFPATSNFGHLP